MFLVSITEILLNLILVRFSLMQGMRIVHSESEFLEALASAQRESQAAFGDCRVLIEKYLSRPRHIEVQVLDILSFFK